MTARDLRAGGSTAVDGVTRTMSLALGVGVVVFALLALQGFTAQLATFHPLWSWGVAASMFLPLACAAALSALAAPRTLRILSAVAAVGHLVGLATLVFALPGGHLPGELGAPWLLQVSVIGTSAAAVAWRSAITWPYVLVCVVLLGLDRWRASEYPIPDLAVQDALHALLFDAVFTALALATRRAGRELDLAADAAVRETRAVASLDARRRERSRVEALVHDSVLVALLASARGAVNAPGEARAALARLDEVHATPPAAAVSAHDWAWRVQALATDLAPAARFSYEVDTDAEVPAAPSEAILEAAAEALRNSVCHAGPAARAVHARVGRGEIEVTVLDDGRGFDISRIAPARLGIAVGMVDRMRSVPGGRAAIVSHPGVGTRVSLAWSQP